jgi:hypothetical protein
MRPFKLHACFMPTLCGASSRGTGTGDKEPSWDSWDARRPSHLWGLGREVFDLPVSSPVLVYILYRIRDLFG